MRKSVLETDRQTDGQTQAQVQVLSCASQLKKTKKLDFILSGFNTTCVDSAFAGYLYLPLHSKKN